MSNRQIITDHLLVRWLERVEGYDVEAARKAMDRAGYADRDSEVLEFMYAYCGVDVEKYRKTLTEIVAPAIVMGAKGVRYNGCYIPIKNNELALTALPLSWRVKSPWRRK